MAFGKTGDADAETTWVRRVVALADEPHQLGGVAKRVLRPVVVRLVARRVAVQSQDILDAGSGIPVEDRDQLVTVVTDTGQVRYGGELGFLLNAHDEVVGLFPGGTAGAVGDRDERRLQRLQVRDVGKEIVPTDVSLWWKELET